MFLPQRRGENSFVVLVLTLTRDSLLKAPLCDSVVSAVKSFWVLNEAKH